MNKTKMIHSIYITKRYFGKCNKQMKRIKNKNNRNRNNNNKIENEIDNDLLNFMHGRRSERLDSINNTILLERKLFQNRILNSSIIIPNNIK